MYVINLVYVRMSNSGVNNIIYTLSTYFAFKFIKGKGISCVIGKEFYSIITEGKKDIWLDLRKPSQFAQELNYNLMDNIKDTLMHHPETSSAWL